MEPFIRHLAKTDYLPNHFLTKAYDSRILFVLSGKGKMLFSDRSIPIKKNSFCYYPSGYEYCPLSSKEDALKFIVINFDFSRRYQSVTATFSPVASKDFVPQKAITSHKECKIELYQSPFVIADAAFVRELLENVADEYKKHSMYAKEIAESFLKCALLKIAELQNPNQTLLYQKITAYVDENYKSIKDNSQVASALNYHPYYLNRVLIRHTGITLHKYITKVRLTKAAELLIFSDMTVTETAREVGIDNPNHFCSLFSAQYGMAPSVYKKNFRAL